MNIFLCHHTAAQLLQTIDAFYFLKLVSSLWMVCCANVAVLERFMASFQRFDMLTFISSVLFFFLWIKPGTIFTLCFWLNIGDKDCSSFTTSQVTMLKCVTEHDVWGGAPAICTKQAHLQIHELFLKFMSHPLPSFSFCFLQ